MKMNIIALVITIASSGCMRNECGDGNDKDRTWLATGLSRLGLNGRVLDDESDPSQRWYYCRVANIVSPPVGWLRITDNYDRRFITAVAGWVRPNSAQASAIRVTTDQDERFHFVALRTAQSLTGGAPQDVKCQTSKEVVEELDRFIECKAPVERGPVTPGGGNDPDPFPPGSTSGDY